MRGRRIGESGNYIIIYHTLKFTGPGAKFKRSPRIKESMEFEIWMGANLRLREIWNGKIYNCTASLTSTNHRRY